ncbi:MAG: butyrate kinase [Bacteroidota bacterium]
MEQPRRILVINPGSTSTKLALYLDDQAEECEEVQHDPGTPQRSVQLWDQYRERLHRVREWAFATTRELSAVVGRGGLLRPVAGGTYRVNHRMLEDARANVQGEHASNLGCAMAHALAEEYGCEAFVVDPVSVDELEPLARYSGHPVISRKSLSHALNIHAAARRAAAEMNLPFRKSSFIVVHLGGGISVAPVRGGRIIDINDASSDGPFSPERTGGLPLQQFITLCFSGSHTEQEARSLVMGTGGLLAYLGTSAAPEIEKRIREGDDKAREVYEAMAYQIAKEVGAMAAVLCGSIQAIVLTGGLAGSTMLTRWIRDRVEFIAPIRIYPGEDEMKALATGALGVLTGDTTPLEY